MRPVINLITLIGWNYSIQTGEDISTNESTRIYNRPHGLYPGLWLDSTAESLTLFTFSARENWISLMSLLT